MEKRQRLGKVLQGFTVILFLGCIYLFIFLSFGAGIPCIFNKLTGVKCPGCGMTHAIAALCRGDVEEALEDNILCISVLPVTCLYLFYRAICYVNGREERFHIWEYALLILLFAVTVGYGVLRNYTFR